MRFHVKDIMTRKILHISPEMNARDAMKLLLKHRMSGLPVIDDSGSLVGVFTEREILGSILPVYLKDVGAFVYVQDPKAELRKMAKLDQYKVKDLMRKEVPTLEEDSAIAEASRIMFTTGERRIVVLRQKKPVGVVTRVDVVRAFAKEAGILR